MKSFRVCVQFFTGPWASLESTCTHFLAQSFKAHIQKQQHTHTEYLLLWQHRHGRRPWRHAWVTTVVSPLAVPEPAQRGWWGGWRCWGWWRGAMWPQDRTGSTAVGSGPRFRGVGEGEGGGVDDSIIADQRDGDLDRLSHPAPALPEGRNVRHHTQDALSASKRTNGWDKVWVFEPLHANAHTQI